MPQQARLIAGTDLMISTGCVGYLSSKSFDRLLSAIEGPRPWFALFVQRTEAFDDLRTYFEGCGMRVEKLEGINAMLKGKGQALRAEGFRATDPTTGFNLWHVAAATGNFEIALQVLASNGEWPEPEDLGQEPPRAGHRGGPARGPADPPAALGQGGRGPGRDRGPGQGPGGSVRHRNGIRRGAEGGLDQR